MNRWLLIAGDLTPYGGQDSANLALARYLSATGRDVDLVTHRCDEELMREPKVRVHTVRRPLNSHFLGFSFLAAKGRSVAQTVGGDGACVLANGGNCVWNDVNWVHYVHAAFPQNKAAGAFWRRWKTQIANHEALAAERKILPASRVVICNSERTRRDVVERLGVPETRAHVVYYGCDPTRFNIISEAERRDAREFLAWPTDRPVVAFVGALGDRRKGFDTLFSAWQELCRMPQWDCDLAVLGGGGELADWRRKAVDAGMEDRIRFMGFRHDVPRVLAACDAMVHPARYEAYGLGVQEALCRGLPSLVSADAGVAEKFPDNLGWLLFEDPQDFAEVASRLSQWRSRLEETREHVESWANSLREYTWDTMAADIVRFSETG